MLTSKLSAMGPTAAFGPTFLKQITTSLGIVEELVQEQADKEQAALLRAAMQNKRKSTSNSLNVHVPKLEDAHSAGGPQGIECTLILTEGRSEEHTSETPVTNAHPVCRPLLVTKNNNTQRQTIA